MLIKERVALDQIDRDLLLLARTEDCVTAAYPRRKENAAIAIANNGHPASDDRLGALHKR